MRNVIGEAAGAQAGASSSRQAGAAVDFADFEAEGVCK
jgi:hypothetical protein